MTLHSEASRPQPDLVVIERGIGPRHGDLMPVKMVTTVVEVVSKKSVERDYGVKRPICAAAHIPAYLVIDPVMGQCVLFTGPVGEGDQADHRGRRITKFGDRTPLEPLGIELAIHEFATYREARPHHRP